MILNSFSSCVYSCFQYNFFSLLLLNITRLSIPLKYYSQNEQDYKILST